MAARRGGLTAEQKAEMAEQTAKEKREQMTAEGTYVSPTKEPEFPEIDLVAEAERIYAEDLADPAAVDFDIDAVNQAEIDALRLAAEMESRRSSLHKKLAMIRANFGFIGKTGTNTGVGGGYGFVEAVHVARRFVEMASELNLTMLPIYMQVVDTRPSASGKQMVYSLNSIWRITDADTGEFIDVHSFGQGADQADKALPKAQTNAMKYAILLVLQAAGDDPENDPRTDQIENTPTGPGLVVGPSNVPGVRAGGRQNQVTDAQMDTFKRLAGAHKLEPGALCILIDQTIGKMPVLPEGGETRDEQLAILDFIGRLSFDEAGAVLRTLDGLSTAST